MPDPLLGHWDGSMNKSKSPALLGLPVQQMAKHGLIL